jgi:flagellar biosynthetic protein FlhB
MNAPKLIAKGAGKIAEKIKKLAEEHDIPIVENRELARNLNSLVEIGQEIPPVLFQAVAEILAYIYKIRSNYLHGLA